MKPEITPPNDKKMKLALHFTMIINGRTLKFGTGKKISSDSSLEEIFKCSKILIQKSLDQSIHYRKKIKKEEDFKQWLEEERLKKFTDPLSKSIEEGLK